MGQKFTVQVLNDKEFDSLPYDGIKDSLGFADTKKGLAFVRNTGNKEFDLGTVSHEVNHLIEGHDKNHPDWENGVLHKKGGFFRSIAPVLLGGLSNLLVPGLGAVIGPALAGALPAVVGAASNIGFDQYAKSNHPEQLGAPGQFGDILGAGALGGLEGFGAGNAVQGGIAGGTAAAPGFASKAGGILSGALTGTAPTASTAGTPGLAGSGGKLLGFGADLAPTGLSNVPAVSALSSSVPAAGTAAANAAKFGAGIGAGSSVSAVPQLGLNLLGQTAAFNATNASAPAMSLANGGVGDLAGNSIAPSMSLPGGGVGNVSGMPLLGNATPGVSSPAGSAITPAMSLGNSSAPAAAAKTPFSFKDLVTPSNVLGGASLLGSVSTQSPQFQMPDSVEELRQKIMQGNGLSPLGQQAQSSLQEILSSQPSQINAPANDAYYADTNRRIDLQYDQAKKQLDAAYNQAGQLGSGEYMDQLRKLTQAQADAKDSFVQSENQRRFEYGSNQKFQAIQQSLGVDQNTMNDLVGLTGLDVQTAAMMYGAKAADVTAIRTALGTLGAQSLLKGQGITTQPNVSVTLGK